MSRVVEKAEFIGRGNELTELTMILEKAESGEGQIVFIQGEAGVGKSRLINELHSQPVGQKFNWLSASCISNEGPKRVESRLLEFRSAVRWPQRYVPLWGEFSTPESIHGSKLAHCTSLPVSPEEAIVFPCG